MIWHLKNAVTRLTNMWLRVERERDGKSIDAAACCGCCGSAAEMAGCAAWNLEAAATAAEGGGATTVVLAILPFCTSVCTTDNGVVEAW